MIEILYLAWNRAAFTALSWHLLMANTDWSLVNRLTVYDDGSEDGTLEYLREHIDECPVKCELRETDLRSPPAIMNHFLAQKRVKYFAKVDNDIACPPGWLNALLTVMEAEPKVELLGAEAGQTIRPPETPFTYEWQPSSHIGGVGLMRTEAFHIKGRSPLPSRGRFGFTEWQSRYRLVRGWISPDLLMPQLDRVPTEPWRSHSEQYVENRWQRDWGHYPLDATHYWDWCVELRGQEAA